MITPRQPFYQIDNVLKVRYVDRQGVIHLQQDEFMSLSTRLKEMVNEIDYLQKTLDAYKDGGAYNNDQHMKHIESLYKENKELKNALAFYANKDNWLPQTGVDRIGGTFEKASLVESDYGTIARQQLKEQE